MGFQDYLGRIANAVKGADEDISEDFHERITSPFLISFLISFLIINWEMWTGLLFLTREDLKAMRYENQLDYIRAHINLCLNFWKPFWFSLGYTIVYPVLREGVRIARAWISTGGSKLMNKVLKDNRVPLEVLVARRKEINRIEKELNEVLSKESQTVVALAAKKKELDEERERFFDLDSRHKQLLSDSNQQVVALKDVRFELKKFRELDEQQSGLRLSGWLRLTLSDGRVFVLQVAENHLTIEIVDLGHFMINNKIFSVRGMPGFLSLMGPDNMEIIFFFSEKMGNDYRGKVIFGNEVYNFLLQSVG